MKNKKILQIILIILIICVFGAIFKFSSQQSEQSEGLSRKISGSIISIEPDNKKLNQQQYENILAKVDCVIRKIAHFSIYTILGIVLISLFITVKLDQDKSIMITVVIGILYAMSDEIHQNFVDGRSPMVTDVMIDTAGVMFGICIILGILRIIKTKKNKL